MAALMSTRGGRFGRGSWNEVGTGLGWRFDAELASVGPVEVEMAGVPFDPPASFVDQGVVMAAEEDQIVETGGTTF